MIRFQRPLFGLVFLSSTLFAGLSHGQSSLPKAVFQNLDRLVGNWEVSGERNGESFSEGTYSAKWNTDQTGLILTSGNPVVGLAHGLGIWDAAAERYHETWLAADGRLVTHSWKLESETRWSGSAKVVEPDGTASSGTAELDWLSDERMRFRATAGQQDATYESTRLPASKLSHGNALKAVAATSLHPRLKALEPILGTWRRTIKIGGGIPEIGEPGTVQEIVVKNSIDQNGTCVRWDGPMGVEYHFWDKTTETLRFVGFHNTGYHGKGTIQPIDGGLNFDWEFTHIEGDIITGRTEMRFVNEDDTTWQLIGMKRNGNAIGDWPLVHNIRVKESPWEWLTGKWKLTDDTGFSSEVEWTTSDDASSVIGQWLDADGSTATEILGWKPESETISAVGFGVNGSHWNIEFTSVSPMEISGHSVDVRANGTTYEGTFRLIRTDDPNKVKTEFRGKDKDENQVTILGQFERIR